MKTDGNGDPWNLRRQGITDEGVLTAMATVSRRDFMPEEIRRYADSDTPAAIGYGQTISQPYIVAYMTEQVRIRETDRILEIGTGSGYQAAILGFLAKRVDTFEIVPELAERARRTLRVAGFGNVFVHEGDGAEGLPDRAPFDVIIVTAAAPRLPDALVDQLGDGGRMILPLVNDGGYEDLVVLNRSGTKVSRHRRIAVRFVPMTGTIRDIDYPSRLRNNRT